jgi:hypothetical protein
MGPDQEFSGQLDLRLGQIQIQPDANAASQDILYKYTATVMYMKGNFNEGNCQEAVSTTTI